jgi:small subunit ribosomal protein S20
MRGAVKDLAANQDAEKAAQLTAKAQKVFDRAVAKNVIHKNKAARLKSRLMKKPTREKTD